VGYFCSATLVVSQSEKKLPEKLFPWVYPVKQLKELDKNNSPEYSVVSERSPLGDRGIKVYRGKKLPPSL
jgi:hypothetical protein